MSVTDAGRLPKLRILIADDHPAITVGLMALMTPFGIEGVGQINDVDGLLAEYRRLRPDVLVLDIRFGDEPKGITAAKDLIAHEPAAKIVMYSQFDDLNIIAAAYKAGALAFATKVTPPDVLATAIREAAAGKTWFLPEVATRLATQSVRGDQSLRTLLDPREMSIFLGIARGQTNQQISEELELSMKTVSVVRGEVARKLGLIGGTDAVRVEMALLARSQGLLPPK